MPSDNIQGRVIFVGDLQQFPSGFQKRQFVIETDEQYSTVIPLEMHKDKADLVSKDMMGKTVSVAYNLRGNEHNGKYYLSAVAWNWKEADVDQSLPPEQSQPMPQSNAGCAPDDGELPF